MNEEKNITQNRSARSSQKTVTKTTTSKKPENYGKEKRQNIIEEHSEQQRNG